MTVARWNVPAGHVYSRDILRIGRARGLADIVGQALKQLIHLHARHAAAV